MTLADGVAFGTVGLLLAWAGYCFGFWIWANARWPASGRHVRLPDARIHVMEAGAGPMVLAIHGASANARELWGPLQPLLQDTFRFVAMDRPGYGHSSRPARAHQLATQARLAAGVIEAAGAGPAIVVAHSLGGATALRLALDRPDLVAGLVLVAPASHPYPGGNAWHAYLASVPVLGWLFAASVVPIVGPMQAGPGAVNVFAPAPVPANYSAEAGVMLLFRPGMFCANARDITATKAEFAAQVPRYAEIQAPTVIISADKDRVVPPQIHAQALMQVMRAGELVTLAGVGHMPHRLRPDVVAAAVRRIAAMAPETIAP
ncbi:MAG: alpha/beta fold hydrolase [Caulobacterales bacterium]